VNVLEAIWLALNLATLFLTLVALTDALADQSAVKLLNGHAREIAAAGIVRRESFRVVIQGLLLVAILPAIFGVSAGVTIAALMTVPVVLLTSSLLDSRERKRMTIMVAADILTESVKAMARLEDAVAENTHLTTLAGQHADNAFREANAVNEKIANQGAAILAQGEVQVVSSDAVARMEATVGHTSEQVEEIHHATVRDDVT